MSKTKVEDESRGEAIRRDAGPTGPGVGLGVGLSVGHDGGLGVGLLGPLEVHRDGKLLTLPASKKTRALLGYLSATATPHLRERLCDLLWDGPDDPRAALRWSLSKIRALLGPAASEVLQADRETVAFIPPSKDVDARAVRGSLAVPWSELPVAKLEAAAARFRGPFLEGLDLGGSHRYHAWWVAEREAFHGQHVALRRTLVERLRDRPEEALRHARLLVGLDPLAESSHCVVIRLLADLGRVREALEQAQQCRQILADELRAAPSRELERLQHDLGASPRVALSPAGSSGLPSALPSAFPSPSISPSPPPSLSPLVGRENEQRAFAQALEAAARGEGRPPLLVVGEAGLGKSRLLEELRALALGRGGLVLEGRAFEAEITRPYGPWIDAFRAPGWAEAVKDQSDLAPLFFSTGPPPREGDRARLFEAVARVLRQRAQTNGIVVVTLDDLQWIDEASAALFHYVARSLPSGAGTGGIVLAGAARAGEVEDNPAALRLVRGLEHGQNLVRLILRPLAQESVAALLALVAPEADPVAVFAASEGHPLFTWEIARAVQRGEGVGGAPLDALIRERLASLPAQTRTVLSWAAALGRRFDPDHLGRVTGLPPGELVAVLDVLEQRGILQSKGAADYDFCHDLVRQGAYVQMSEPRRRLVHLQIARSLGTLPDEDGSWASDVAFHAGQGGDHEVAARACLAAAERCLRLFAHREAGELATKGIEHAQHLGPVVRVPLQMQLLRSLTVNPEVRERRRRPLEAQLARLVVDAQGAGLADQVALGLHLRGIIVFEHGEFEEAHALTMQATTTERARDPRAAAHQVGSMARCLALIEKDMGRVQALIEEAQVALARLDVSPEAVDVLEVDWAKALFSHFTGNHQEAVARLEKVALVSERHGLRWEQCDVLTRLAVLDLERGRYAEVRQRCDVLLPVAARMGEGSELPAARALHALAAYALAEPEAANALEAALVSLEAVDAKGMLAFSLVLASELDVGAGRFSLAASRAARGLTAALAVDRQSQAALARAVLLRLALGEMAPDKTVVLAHAQALAVALSRPLALSARAAAAARAVLDSLDSQP